MTGERIQALLTRARRHRRTRGGTAAGQCRAQAGEGGVACAGATLQGILDAAQESIWLFSTDERVLLANTIALQRLGIPAAEVIGKSTLDLMPTELIRARLARCRQVIDTGQPLEFDDERAGIRFHHCFNPVFAADGRVDAIACFSRDITERTRTEALIKRQHEELRGLAIQLAQTQETERAGSRGSARRHRAAAHRASLNLKMIAHQFPDGIPPVVQTLLERSLQLVKPPGSPSVT